MNENITDQLKQLVLDENFTELQNLVNKEVNLMDILNVSHRELQHSNFLAWFFHPKETHNLGDFAIKEFIKIYFKKNQHQDLGKTSGLSVFKFVNLNFDDLEIKRESKDIDLLFLSKKERLCIVIENKIHATEGEGQLKKYMNKVVEIENEIKNETNNDNFEFDHKIFIYLSLEDQEISEEEYIQLNYEYVFNLIEQVLKLNLADNIKWVFEQYKQTLISLLKKNNEVEVIAEGLYKDYKVALDYLNPKYNKDIENIEKQVFNKYESSFNLVFKYRPDIVTKLQEIYIKKIEELGWKVGSCNKSMTRFTTNALFSIIPEKKGKGIGGWSNKEIFLFEIVAWGKEKGRFKPVISPGDPTIRKILCEAMENIESIPNKFKKNRVSEIWSVYYQYDWDWGFDVEEMMEKDEKKVLDRIDDVWNTIEYIVTEVEKGILKYKDQLLGSK